MLRTSLQDKHRSRNNCLDSIVAITLRRDVAQEMLDSCFSNDTKDKGKPMNLAEILTAKGSTVFTIGADATLEQAVSRLVDHNIGSLVVCSRDVELGEQPIGMITERDILHACSSRSGHDLATTRVEDVMSTSLSTASPTDLVENMMGLMTKRRIRHLPVLSEGRLVGLVSIGDIVKAQHNRLAMENQFMKDYIHKG